MHSTMHKSSLVDSSSHSPAMLELLELCIDRALIDHIVRSTVDVVSFAMGDASPSFSSRGRTSISNKHALFSSFAFNVIRRSQVTVPTLLVTLVYINRARPHLIIQSGKWACERVFLGALVLAAKYLNDISLKNVHWAACTGVFGKRDIGRIEREFLHVLDWGLAISEADILDHHDAILSLYDRSRGTPNYGHPLRRRSHKFHRDEVEDAESSSTSTSSSSSSSSAQSSSPRTPPTPESGSHHPSCVKSPSTLKHPDISEVVPHSSRVGMSSVHLPSHWSKTVVAHPTRAVPANTWSL